MRKLKVGFTIQINDPKDSFWTNGIKQNAVTLQECFSLCPNVENAYLVNLGKLTDYKDTVWQPFSDKIINFEKALEELDVLITATVTPTNLMVERLQEKKIILIKHIMGNEYQMFSEQMLFSEEQSNTYKKRRNHKAVWISPHLFDQNKDFFEVVCEAPASIGPYVWSHKFIDNHVKAYMSQNEGHTGLYTPRGEQEKLISSFEPNINLLKTLLTPVVTAEKMFNKAPELIKKFSMFGADRIKKKKILVEFAGDLNVYKNKKLFFESRYPIVWALFTHTDILLSHQRDLELNYLYFDAAWLGVPVVHNASMVKELGYYYEGWDADQAVDQVINVAKNFDSSEYERRKYLDDSRRIISEYLPEHKRNVEGYAELLEKAI